MKSALLFSALKLSRTPDGSTERFAVRNVTLSRAPEGFSERLRLFGLISFQSEKPLSLLQLREPNAPSRRHFDRVDFWGDAIICVILYWIY